ncbi:hypothetical protein BBW78_00140 [Listeria monocytogenes]|nr:hypothetical protein [Listeria monocytogenes]
MLLLLNPNAPRKVTNVKSTNITPTGADISWNSVTGANSYVIRYGVDGQTNDRLHYSETASFRLDDAVFAGELAGLKVNVYIQAFEKIYTGSDEIAKANAAMVDNADVWSNVCTIDFPSK